MGHKASIVRLQTVAGKVLCLSPTEIKIFQFRSNGSPPGGPSPTGFPPSCWCPMQGNLWYPLFVLVEDMTKPSQASVLIFDLIDHAAATGLLVEFFIRDDVWLEYTADSS